MVVVALLGSAIVAQASHPNIRSVSPPLHERTCSDLLSGARIIIRKYDANGDRVLDRVEWKVAFDDFVSRANENGVPAPTQGDMLRDFDLVDRNRDGRIEAQELALGEGPVSAFQESCFKN